MDTEERNFLNFFDQLIKTKKDNNEKIIENIVNHIKNNQNLEKSKLNDNNTTGNRFKSLDSTDYNDDSNNNLELKNNLTKKKRKIEVKNSSFSDKDDKKNNNKEFKVILNRKYEYNLVKNKNMFLQYSLNRLIKGITTNEEHIRQNFGTCLYNIMSQFNTFINFDTLIQFFFKNYSIANKILQNYEIKYMYIGMLEIISQLCKINFFQYHNQVNDICKIVECILEAYKYKVYLQDSSNVLLINLVEQIGNRGDNLIFNQVVRKIVEQNTTNNVISLYIKQYHGEKINSSINIKFDFSNLNFEEKQNSDLVNEHDLTTVICKVIYNMKNNYPFVDLYLVYLINKINVENDVDMLKRILNVANYVMENNVNSSKFGLILILLLLFNVKPSLFHHLVDNLGTFTKTISKYYRFNNTQYIKQFVNNYLKLFSYLITNYETQSFNFVDIILLLYEHLIDKNVNKDIILYTNFYKQLLKELYQKPYKKEIKKDNLWNNENVYKLLNVLFSNNINPFLNVIKSLLSKLVDNSQGNVLEVFNDLVKFIENQNYQLLLSKLLILNNNYSILNHFLSHYLNQNSTRKETEKCLAEVLNVFVDVIIKFVNNDEFYKTMNDSVDLMKQTFEEVHEKTDILKKFFNLTKENEKNSELKAVSQLLYIYYLLKVIHENKINNSENEQFEMNDTMLEVYLDKICSYLNGNSTKETESDENLHYLLLHYLFSHNSESSLTNKRLKMLFNLINKIIYKNICKYFTPELWQCVISTTLTGQRDLINSKLAQFNNNDEEEIECEEDESCEESESSDYESDAISYNNDVDDIDDQESAGNEDSDESVEDDDEKVSGEENDDVLLDNFNMLLNEEPVPKPKLNNDKEKGENEKIIGYTLLLNIHIKNVNLNNLFQFLKDYNKSFNSQYHQLIYKFLSTLSNQRSNLNFDDVNVSNVDEDLKRIVNLLMYNKNFKNVFVVVFKIVNNITGKVEKIINEVTSTVFTKRTVVNFNHLTTLYKDFDVRCSINLLKLLKENVKKNVIRSNIFNLYTFLLNNRKLKSTTQDLEVIHKLLSETMSEESDVNYSKQYIKSLVTCVNILNKTFKHNKSENLNDNKDKAEDKVEYKEKLELLNQLIKEKGNKNKFINKFYNHNLSIV